MKERICGKKTLVLGLGNPLSGDDRFGSLVLERLGRDAAELPQNVSLANAHTDLLNHIDGFAACDGVILIDAILDPAGRLGLPGSIVTLDEAAFKSWPETSPDAHEMAPMLGIRLFRTLHPEAQTEILLVGLLVDQLRHEPQYSTDDRIEEAAAAIRRLIS